MARPRSEARERKPLGMRRDALGVSKKDESYNYRWFNHDGDRWRTRIADALEAGYEKVVDRSGEIATGADGVNVPRSPGSVVSRPMGAGVQGILMRIPKDVYVEDQTAKQEAVDKVDAELKRDFARAAQEMNDPRARLQLR
jgi:hypothetical protein